MFALCWLKMPRFVCVCVRACVHTCVCVSPVVSRRILQSHSHWLTPSTDFSWITAHGTQCRLQCLASNPARLPPVGECVFLQVFSHSCQRHTFISHRRLKCSRAHHLHFNRKCTLPWQQCFLFVVFYITCSTPLTQSTLDSLLNPPLLYVMFYQRGY